MDFILGLLGPRAEKYKPKDWGIGNAVYIQTDRGEYAPGDTIYGTVYVRCTEMVPSNGLTVKISGKSKVEFHVAVQQSHWVNGQQEFRTIQQKQEFEQKVLKSELKLLGPGDFPPGNHVYYFRYTLPQLPATFHWEKGTAEAKIKYSAKVTLDIPKTSDDLTAKVPIFVLSPSKHRDYAPTYTKAHTVRTMCCIPRGSVTATLKLDRGEYRQGEVVQAQLDLDNQSSVEIDGLNVRLIRTTILTAGGHSFTDSEVLCEARHPGVAAKTAASRAVPMQLNFPGRCFAPNVRSPNVTCTYHLMAEVSIPFAPDLEFLDETIVLPVPNPFWASFRAPEWAPTAQPGTVLAGYSVPSEEMTKVYQAR